MRSDLDAVRERHILRETREEAWGLKSGDWGWVKTHANEAHRATEAKKTNNEPPRPGTQDGGF